MFQRLLHRAPVVCQPHASLLSVPFPLIPPTAQCSSGGLFFAKTLDKPYGLVYIINTSRRGGLAKKAEKPLEEPRSFKKAPPVDRRRSGGLFFCNESVLFSS